MLLFWPFFPQGSNEIELVGMLSSGYANELFVKVKFTPAKATALTRLISAAPVDANADPTLLRLTRAKLRREPEERRLPRKSRR